MDSDPILIKRYDGSRHHNTVTAIYVTLPELENLILQDRRFIVREADTGRDITREILDRLY